MRSESRVSHEFSLFVSETSFTPLIVIYNSNSFLKRMTWIIVVLAFFVYSCVQCYGLLDKFFAYPTEMKLELKAATELEFPSVTICNLNPIRKSEIKQEPFNGLSDFAEPDISDFLFQQIIGSWTFADQCTLDQYKCNNGKCIPYIAVCDGKNNCGNNDDESKCEERTCSPTYFRCPTGKCIPSKWLCDNNPDCPNGEDEDCFSSENSTTITNETSESTPATKTDILTTMSSSMISAMNSPMGSSTSHQSLSSSTTAPPPPRPKREAKIDAKHDKSKLIPRAIRERLKSMKYDLGTAQGRQLATKELYRSFKVFLKSQRKVVKGERKQCGVLSLEIYLEDFSNQVLDTAQIIGESHKNRVRKIRSVYDNYKDRSIASLNWTDVLCNSSFNKWDALEQNGSTTTNFYDMKDDEYLASMTYSYITTQLDQSVVEKAGHTKNDFIASCKFDSLLCSPMNFTYLHNHKYGNCYTFNHLNQNTKLTTQFPGPGHGLLLELFINQDQYVANLAPEAGARVVIHKKGTMPFPEDEGISVMPGRSISIGIKQVIYTRLPPPHGVCGDIPLTRDYYARYKGTIPSKLSCLKSCYQDLILEICECSVPFFYITDNVTVCNMTNTNTANCVTELPKTETLRLKQCDNICPQPCSETRYELSSSSAVWPSQQYEKFLLERLKQTNALYINVGRSEDEFAKVQIYYQDLIYQEILQQIGYETMSLISDLGGQLGLWLGLSAITIGEFCSFLCSICTSLPSVCRGSKTKPVQTTPAAEIQPATLEEIYEDVSKLPIYDPPGITYPIKSFQ